MASKRATVADTSFYIFFLDDIDGLGYLAAIARSCKLVVTTLVMKELSRKRGAERLRKMVVPAGLDYDMARALHPAFYGGRPARGEHDVVMHCHMMHKDGIPFTMIIDDAPARRFAVRNFAHLERFMTGTLGFVAECHRNGTLKRGDAERVLEAMKASRFRVPDDLVDKALREVRGA